MRKLFLLASLLCIVSFALLSKYEDRAFMRSMDFAVTVKVQERIDGSSRLRLASAVANVMEGSAFFAGPALTVMVTLILTGIAAYDRKEKRFHAAAALIPISLVLLVAFEVFGKSIVHHPSPPFSMIKNPTSIFPADYVNEQYSYPSGHAARALFMGLIGFVLLKNVRNPGVTGTVAAAACVAAFVVTVSVSKVYFGHHWFSDVVGGLLVGAGTGLLACIGCVRKRV